MNSLVNIKNNLLKVVEILPKLIKQEKWKGAHITFSYPNMDRVYCLYKDLRVSLHKVFPAKPGTQLYHSHPWDLAVKMYKGKQEVGFGFDFAGEYGATCKMTKIGKQGPEVSFKGDFVEGDSYTMRAITEWHHIMSIEEPSWTLMVNGPQFQYRERPKNFGTKMTNKEVNKFLAEWKNLC